MKKPHPVYTEQAECQDCYKCVRHCPVKSIRIIDHHAAVMDDDCTACGLCVTVCPSGAKKSRNDRDRVKQLLASGVPVVLSLAPSFVASFPGVSTASLIRALRKLGFAEVSETALGAEAVSLAVGRFLVEDNRRLALSTACPAVVRYVARYRQDLLSALTPFSSPLLTHAEMVKEARPGTHLVFAGPCIAKHLEADAHPGLVDAVVTFADLHQLFKEAGISPERENGGAADIFYPRAAGMGGLYPSDGGMIRGIEPYLNGKPVRMLTLSGLDNICRTLEGLSVSNLRHPLFLELLACPGGCINGPRLGNKQSALLRMLAVTERPESSRIPETVGIAHPGGWATVTVPGLPETAEIAPASLVQALKSVGKVRPEDELNCGGCGYEDCRALARALVLGRAEPAMCVSYMRKLAQQKANALIRSLPLGVVLADGQSNVLECNRAFAALCGASVLECFEQTGSLEGMAIGRLLPFGEFFAGVLRTHEEMVGREVAVNDRVYRLTLFPVDPGRVVGAVIADITEPVLSREAVIEKAQEVIDKQLSTVQRIACLLGENAAETEVLLRSLINAFSVRPKPQEPPGPSQPLSWKGP